MNTENSSPPMMGKIADYWSWRSEVYHTACSRHPQWHEIFLSPFEGKQSLRLLDMGTGTGFLALGFAERGHRVTGVDLSPEMIAFAKKEALRQNLSVEFLEGNAQEPPFPEEKLFDGITCRNLLWTLPNPLQALRAWKKLLKPEGTVVVGELIGGKRSAQRILEAETTPSGANKRWTLPALISSIFVIAAIAAMLLINVLVLAFSYASPEKETSINGVIPYIFQSYTMEPAIMYNDVALFRKVDTQEKLNIGDIILYKDIAGTVNVGELISFETDPETFEETGNLTTDILYYADERYRGMAEQTVSRDLVYGVHIGNNRWFGAIVLFANTIIGRLILLLIPTFLIFFYEPIVNFFKTITKEKTEKVHL